MGHLGLVDNLTVPVQRWGVVNECGPFGEGGVGPLGNVQVMDHIAGGFEGSGTQHIGKQHRAALLGWLH